jgi:replicative DNA helicase
MEKTISTDGSMTAHQHSVFVEEMILHGLINNPAYSNKVIDTLTEDLFHYSEYKKVFKAVKELRKTKKGKLTMGQIISAIDCTKSEAVLLELTMDWINTKGNTAIIYRQMQTYKLTTQKQKTLRDIVIEAFNASKQAAQGTV